MLVVDRSGLDMTKPSKHLLDMYAHGAGNGESDEATRNMARLRAVDSQTGRLGFFPAWKGDSDHVGIDHSC